MTVVVVVVVVVDVLVVFEVLVVVPGGGIELLCRSVLPASRVVDANGSATVFDPYVRP